VAVAALATFFLSHPVEAESPETAEMARAITEPGRRIEERLANIFQKQGNLFCMDVARSLQDPKLTVFKRGEKLAELTQCVDRLRATTVRQEVEFGAQAADAVEYTDSLLAEARPWLASATEQNTGDRKFLNLSWGAGFGFSHAFDDVIENAEIVNGIVRITEDRTQQPRVVLEFHRYFGYDRTKTPVSFGVGPFVAVAAAENDVLSGVGAGVMFGWRSQEDAKGSGFSIGLGAILDGDVKSLGEGFEENEPPPPGETSVRFEEKARWSALVFFTRTF
jgi:hypothetical protein